MPTHSLLLGARAALVDVLVTAEVSACARCHACVPILWSPNSHHVIQAWEGAATVSSQLITGLEVVDVSVSCLLTLQYITLGKLLHHLGRCRDAAITLDKALRR